MRICPTEALAGETADEEDAEKIRKAAEVIVENLGIFLDESEYGRESAGRVSRSAEDSRAVGDIFTENPGVQKAPARRVGLEEDRELPGRVGALW